jgi:hypothetical protein
MLSMHIVEGWKPFEKSNNLMEIFELGAFPEFEFCGGNIGTDSRTFEA